MLHIHRRMTSCYLQHHESGTFTVGREDLKSIIGSCMCGGSEVHGREVGRFDDIETRHAPINAEGLKRARDAE